MNSTVSDHEHTAMQPDVKCDEVSQTRVPGPTWLPWRWPVMAKTFRDDLPALLLCVVAIVVFHWFIMNKIFPVWDDRIALFHNLDRFFKAFFGGSDLNVIKSFHEIVAIAYLHPVQVTVLCVLPIMHATRIMTAEIGNGTVDLLLSVPLRRWQLIVSGATVLAVDGAVLCAAMVVGDVIGARGNSYSEPLEVTRLVMMAGSSYLLFLALGGISMAAAAISTHRSTAVGISVTAILASYAWNFFCEYAEKVEIRNLDYLSLYHYHRPIMMMRENAFITHDATVLLCVAGAGLLLAIVCFSLRDLRTT